MIEPLRISVDVACDPARAFELWTVDASSWWPRDHSMSADPGLTVVFEPGVGGRIFERTVDGTEHDWGEVTAWEPPARLVYQWHIGSTRSDATEVEVRFSKNSEGGTTVAIEHRGWDRLAEDGPPRREANRRGWSGVLEDYVAACGEDSSR